MKNNKLNKFRIAPVVMIGLFGLASAVTPETCSGYVGGMGYLGDVISILIMVVLGLTGIWLFQKITEKSRGKNKNGL
ncbi:MAG: hypothetical protein PF542_01160 [Nanoarchaeota archaeon]|nr:hypothetical protein [Nanoarchaeota archaeon]